MISNGGFNSSNRHTQPMAEINTTPLVDVMLVLLVIFIITAPLLTHAIKIDLPKAGNQVEQNKVEAITVSLNGEGNLFWNDKPITEPELSQQLTQAAAHDPQPELHLRADKATSYEKLAIVMAAVQTAGIEKLGFITEPVTGAN
jgi:biopolymer transport protein ExbD